MKSFSESGLLFDFEDSWNLIKYDTHRYYLTLSGRSFSGVDFAGFHNDNLYLIEVKNFYQYNQNGVIKDVEAFSIEVAEKIKDTIRLIELIHKYHTRKWMYRLLFPVVRRFPRWNNDWLFWTAMARNISEGKNTHFVLYILADHSVRLIRHNIKEALEDDVGEYVKLIIINKENERDLPACTIL